MYLAAFAFWFRGRSGEPGDETSGESALVGADVGAAHGLP
jgi:hypothetical protein